jgi:hypothetical protein
MSNIKKRTVILLGAGAAIPWDGPNTETLTSLLKQDNLSGKANSRIFEILEKSETYPSESINFESILHFIESLISYERSNYISSFRNIYKSISHLNEAGKSLRTLIVETPWKTTRWHYDNTQNYFYDCLVALLRYNYYDILYPELSKYLRNDSLEAHEQLNKSIINFINRNQENSTVRIYTTNYDRLIPRIFEKYNSAKEVFDGFYLPDRGQNTGTANIARILNDDSCLNYYNLHGSAYWGINDINQPNFHSFKRWVKSANFNNNEKYFSQSQPFDEHLLTPIISGYNKLNKVQITPLRHFMNAFEKDVYLATEIIIVGYSFSDPHINNVIKVPLNTTGKNTLLNVITKDDTEIAKKLAKVLPHNIKEENLKIYNEGFDQYLKSK